MRQVCLLIAVLLCMDAQAIAQVTVDLHALDALPGAKPPTHEPVPHRAPRASAPKRTAVAKPAKPAPVEATAQPEAPPTGFQPATPAPTVATAPAAPTPPPATLPVAPPATVAIAPVVPPPPPADAAPPAPPPISDTATSAATATSAGLRVTFGAGEAELSPDSAASIKKLVQSAPSGGDTSFNVVAYAAGTPDDPSTARRLSLSRALAVRSALMANGVSSARIYVRALGAPEGDQTPDRVDLAVLGGNAPAATNAATKSPTQ